MAYVITEACIDEVTQDCIDVCPVDCIPVNPQFVESREQLERKYALLVRQKAGAPA